MVSPTSKQHNTAVLLARKGFKVFPCQPQSKVPATSHGCKNATSDWTTIDGWWTACPEYNVAIATGKASGVFVIDVDSDEGEAALKQMEDELGALPPTVEAITAKGRHIYFKMSETAVPNSAKTLGPGLDVRGDGGYVMAPSSIHETGWVYCWSVDCASSMAWAPDGLLARVTRKTNGNGKAEPTPTTEWVRLVADGVAEGQRDCTATKLAGYLLHHRIQVDVTLGLMRIWNELRCRPPLPGADIDRVVNSVAGREVERRSGRAR
jgi:hypothetical protein